MISQIVKDLILEASEMFGAEPAQVKTWNRTPHTVRARWYVWFKLRERKWSYPRIAEIFNVNHSSVMYGVKRIAEEIENSESDFYMLQAIYEIKKENFEEETT
jgi:chromosomal replication initiation ATPase DnaA